MPVELHAASAFSFLRASSLPETLVERAADLGYDALVPRRSSTLSSGAPRFFKAARRAGVRPLVGAEVTLEGGCALPLLVESQRGYRNLGRLITRMKAGRPKGEGRVPLAWLEAGAGEPGGALEGLVALPGVETLGRRPEPDRLGRVVDAFGLGNVFLDVQRHRRREQEAANRALLDLADSLGLPALATNGVRHAISRGRVLLDILTCIREKRLLRSAGRLLSENAERHLKGPKAMESLFADRPDLLRRAEALAERLEFTLEDLGYRFPDYPVPAGGEPALLPVSRDGGGGPGALPPLSRPGTPADREGARSHREARARGVLPHRLGPGELLPPRGDPGPGPGVGREQCGRAVGGQLTFGSGGDGSAVRTIPLRGAG